MLLGMPPGMVPHGISWHWGIVERPKFAVGELPGAVKLPLNFFFLQIKMVYRVVYVAIALPKKIN